MGQRGFCASPWIEGVLYQDGTLRACDRAEMVLGNWITDGLASSWNSDSFQSFRRQIVAGEFPESSCRFCVNNLIMKKPFDLLNTSFVQYKKTVETYLGRECSELNALVPLLSMNFKTDRSDEVLRKYFSFLSSLERSPSESVSEMVIALKKLRVLGKILKSFLEGDEKPSEVAPFRQVQLIQRCNSRCKHCIGVHRGWVVRGGAMKGEFLDRAFSCESSIVGFFMNGSEFLLYPRWKEVAHRLERQGVRLSFSTNSILLDEGTIRYLVDNKLLLHLNISMDAATERVLRLVGRRADITKRSEAIKFLYEYAGRAQYPLTLSFTYLLTRLNYHEMAETVYLIDGLRGIRRVKVFDMVSRAVEGVGTIWRALIKGAQHGRESPRHESIHTIVLIQSLLFAENAGYERFVRDNHPARIARESLTREFRRVHRASEETLIPVRVFNDQTIEEFVKAGCPIPSCWC